MNREPSPDELRFHVAQFLERRRSEITSRLSADDAWRLMLASAINALLAVGSVQDAARILREAADLIEAGKPPIN